MTSNVIFLQFYLQLGSLNRSKINEKSMPSPTRKKSDIFEFYLFYSFQCCWKHENPRKTMEGRSNSHFRQYRRWPVWETFRAYFFNNFCDYFLLNFGSKRVPEANENFLAISNRILSDFDTKIGSEMHPGRCLKVSHTGTGVAKSGAIVAKSVFCNF